MTSFDYVAVAEGYLATWNETDPVKRRALVDAVYTADVTYTDPVAAVIGHAGVDALLSAAQEQFAGLVFTLGGVVDGHHNLARFHWHLGPEGHEPVAIGFDVVALDDEGRITAVYGFLDKVPAEA